MFKMTGREWFSAVVLAMTLNAIYFTWRTHVPAPPVECWHGQTIEGGDDCDRVFTSNRWYVR